MIYLQLFISFCKIGFTSFGGLSMIPLIISEMNLHGWMTKMEVLDLAAIAEMTPGPIGVNLATFVGIRMAGLPGALIANLGICMPTFTLCAAAAIFFEKCKSNPTIQKIMKGIRPAALGLLIGAIVILGRSTFYAGNVLEVQGILTACIVMVLIFKFKFNVPRVIVSAGIIGIILGHLMS